MMDALVIGSAACVWDDLRALGQWDGVVVAVNHMAAVYPYRIDHLATLHSDMAGAWVRARKARGGNLDFTIWGRPEREGADYTLSGWSSGSSGLFGVGVALGIGAERVVLAGVPIDETPHFFDHAAWACFAGYRAVWEERASLLRGRVFSMSGWTRELLGSPPWLQLDRAA